MFNRITTNIKQSNDPNELWDSSEVNTELDRIDSRVSELQEDLVTTNTAQSIDGQKTFYNIFVDEGNSVITYDKVMEYYPFDLSPVFGPGTYHFSRNRSVEEGRYEKHNASGTKLDIAALNPCFMPSNVYIEANDATAIYVKASNVPMPVTSLGGSYSPIDSNMTAYLWKSSVGFEGTLDISSRISSFRYSPILLVYDFDLDTVYLQTLDANNSLTVNATNYLVRFIGAVFHHNSALVNSVQSEGSIRFNAQFKFSDLTTPLRYDSTLDKIFSSCILKLSTLPTTSASYLIKYTDSTNYALEILNRLYSTMSTPSPTVMYLPIYSDGKIPEIVSLLNSPWLINEIIFGDLAL